MLSASSACSGNFMSVSRATAEDTPVRGSTAVRDGDKGSLCPSRVGFPTQRRPVVNGMPTGTPTVDPIAQLGPLPRPIKASTFLCEVFRSSSAASCFLL